MARRGEGKVKMGSIFVKGEVLRFYHITYSESEMRLLKQDPCRRVHEENARGIDFNHLMKSKSPKRNEIFMLKDLLTPEIEPNETADVPTLMERTKNTLTRGNHLGLLLPIMSLYAAGYFSFMPIQH